MPFNRVVLSTNDDPKYYEFWPLVAKAWKKFFNGVPVSLAVVSDQRGFAERLALDGCEVVDFDLPEGVPSGNVAKLARYMLAARHPDDVCLIHDIDTVPLQRDYAINLIRQRHRGNLLLVGHEVYTKFEEMSKWPIGYLTGEGYLFRQILAGSESLRVLDGKEDPRNPYWFSDESWLRSALKKVQIPIQPVWRNISPEDWIDRSYWHIDFDRLEAGEYVEANLLRPWHDHKTEIEPIARYIESLP